MRKVTELKENEVIHCRTEKEAKAICELLKQVGDEDLMPWIKGNENIGIDRENKSKSSWASIEYYINKRFTIYPASDFLKAKKIKLQDLTDKHVVVCDNRKQYEKAKQYPNIANICVVGDTGYFKEKTIVPYSHLFPKRKKSKTQKRIEGLEKEMNERLEAIEARLFAVDIYEQKTSTQKQTEAIDWDKPGTYESKDVVVLSTGLHNEGYFEAVCIEVKPLGISSFYHFGKHRIDWVKNSFTPCNVTINIEK